MKKNGLIMLLLFIMSSLSMELVAQENLNALVKKCETMPSLEVDVIKNKNEETKKLEVSVIAISIENNQALVNEFLSAFEKDKEDATKTIENSANGEHSLLCVFDKVSYSISYGEKNGSASVSVLYNFPHK